ncbi:MAG TPA: hypothetical protein VF139_00880 [Candidatus Polarisedimenticolaceae bacterium]
MRSPALLLTPLVVAAAFAADPPGQAEVYRAMGIRPEAILNGSILAAKVVEGGARQTVAIATYLTGKKEDADAVGVKLVVFDAASGLKPLYERDFAKENAGFVGRGEIQLVDLDGDGLMEILPSWDNVRSKLVDERRGEVLVREGGAFKVGWSGELKYDATRAVREVPDDRRDRYEREVDIPATIKTRGITLFFNKKVQAVAGQRLPAPRIVRETFPLRPPPPE